MCDNGFSNNVLLEITDLDAELGTSADGAYLLEFQASAGSSFPTGCVTTPGHLLGSSCCSWAYGNDAAVDGEVACAQFYIQRASDGGFNATLYAVVQIVSSGSVFDLVWTLGVMDWEGDCCFVDEVLVPFWPISFLGSDSRAHITAQDPCTSATECCGDADTPQAGSTCVATIDGTVGCAGNPSHPNDGAVDMAYMGQGVFSPCTSGFDFPAGTMKWIGSSMGEGYFMEVICAGANINVVFYWWKCNGVGGALGDLAIWTGSVATGSCDLTGMVLALSSDPAGCIDPGSTVTLSDFVF